MRRRRCRAHGNKGSRGGHGLKERDHAEMLLQEVRGDVGGTRL
jgi:hypothetical protein